MYRWRHLIENAFAKLKEFRAIATRYDKTDTSFRASISLAAATGRVAGLEQTSCPSTTAGLHGGASVCASGLGGRAADGVCARLTNGAQRLVRMADARGGARAGAAPRAR